MSRFTATFVPANWRLAQILATDLGQAIPCDHPIERVASDHSPMNAVGLSVAGRAYSAGFSL
jgi:hypothetical protein